MMWRWIPLLLLAWILPSTTQAGEGLDVRLRLDASFSPLGSYESLLSGEAGEGDYRDLLAEDLDPSWGGGMEVALHFLEHFEAGVRVGYRAWSPSQMSELGLSRSSWIDSELVGRVSWPIGPSISVEMEVPIGLMVSILSDEREEAENLDWDQGLGLKTGLGLGARWLFEEGFGLFAGVSWEHRRFWHEASYQVFGSQSVVELDDTTELLNLRVGVSFDL